MPPRKKRGKKAALPTFLPPLPSQQAPDLAEYKPVVGGASQAKKRRSRTNRAKKARRTDIWTGPNTSRSVYTKHLRDAACEPTELDWEDMPTTSTGFTAKREETEARVYTLEELRGEEFGFDYLDWAGAYVAHSSSARASADPT